MEITILLLVGMAARAEDSDCWEVPDARYENPYCILNQTVEEYCAEWGGCWTWEENWEYGYPSDMLFDCTNTDTIAHVLYFAFPEASGGGTEFYDRAGILIGRSWRAGTDYCCEGQVASYMGLGTVGECEGQTPAVNPKPDDSGTDSGSEPGGCGSCGGCATAGGAGLWIPVGMALLRRRRSRPTMPGGRFSF